METNDNKIAVVLLSGGLDSATCLAMAVKQGYTCHALSINYGQSLIAELNAAATLATVLGAQSHRVIAVGLNQWGGSALTDTRIAVPDYTGSAEIPVTYVPARNTIFIALALGLAEVLQAQHIFIGANAIDYSGYPDCRPDYFKAWETLARLATQAGVTGTPLHIHTPLLALNKAQIIQQGVAAGVDYRLTVSCYQANSAGEACGRCDSCVLRRRGFQAAGVADPTRYVQP